MSYHLNTSLIQFLAFTDRQLDVHLAGCILIINGDNQTMDTLREHILNQSRTDDPWLILYHGDYHFRIVPIDEHK